MAKALCFALQPTSAGVGGSARSLCLHTQVPCSPQPRPAYRAALSRSWALPSSPLLTADPTRSPCQDPACPAPQPAPHRVCPGLMRCSQALEEARVQCCACMHPRTLPSAWHTVGAQEMLNGEWINDRCSINVERPAFPTQAVPAIRPPASPGRAWPPLNTGWGPGPAVHGAIFTSFALCLLRQTWL